MALILHLIERLIYLKPETASDPNDADLPADYHIATKLAGNILMPHNQQSYR